MTDTLTLNTLVFDKQYSTEAGSLRRETSRGINLPHLLTIKHRVVPNSKTGIQTQQDLVQIDRIQLLSGGTYVPVRVKLTVETPVDSGVVGSDVETTVDLITAILATVANGGLDLADEVFVAKQQ